MKKYNIVVSLLLSLLLLVSFSETSYATGGYISTNTMRYWLPDGTVSDYVYIGQGRYEGKTYDSYVATTLPEFPSTDPYDTYITYKDISIDSAFKCININSLNTKKVTIDGITCGEASWVNFGYGNPGWTYIFSGNNYIYRPMYESDCTIELTEGTILEVDAICLSYMNPSYPNNVIKLKNCIFTISPDYFDTQLAGKEIKNELKVSDFGGINFIDGTFTYCKDTAADGSSEGTPAPVGTELIDLTGNKTGYIVTGEDTVEYCGTESDKKENTLNIPNVVSDLSDNTYSVTAIKAGAFKNNKTIKYLTVGDNINTIGDEAFAGCKKLKSAKLGVSVKSIGTKAFNGCKNLKKISINGDNICKVGKKAFKGIKPKAGITISAKKKATATKLLKKINKTGGAKNAILKYKKIKF